MSTAAATPTETCVIRYMAHDSASWTYATAVVQDTNVEQVEPDWYMAVADYARVDMMIAGMWGTVNPAEGLLVWDSTRTRRLA